MAVGFPTKVTYANGDVFSASDINDTNGTINLINPSAKGDLFAGSAANTYTKLSVGSTNGQVLTVDSTTATGLKWATPAAGAANSSASVATEESTTSTTYANLATSGPAVTVTTGTKALVLLTSMVYKDSAGSNAYASVAVSGATTLAASDANAMGWNSGAYYDQRFTAAIYLSGLTAGSNTFTMRYRQNGGGTAYFKNRQITVIDMGS
jgi:hypothetical protein